MKKLARFLLGFVIGFVSVVLIVCIGCTIGNRISEVSMNEYIDTFGKVEYESQLKPAIDEFGNFVFETDGDFKVMQITDAHIGGGVLSRNEDKKAINAIAAMIATEKPDLVISTGDMSSAYPNSGTLSNKYAHSYFIRLMENLGVYWTVTLGNHDSEIYNSQTREEVGAMYDHSKLEYCLFSAGPEDVDGVGNHTIAVVNSNGITTQLLVMIDTHAYTEDDPLGLKWDYDYVKESQVEWYRDVINAYSNRNKAELASLSDDELPCDRADLETPKSLAFFHIPILEVREAYWEYVNNGCQNTEDTKFIKGNPGEKDPVVFPSETKTALFDTMVELGSTKGCFYGHDHLNNFVLEHKGIIMSYGYSIDYFAYGGIDKYGYQRGCQMITVHPDGSFDITHENYYQDKYVPLYEKEDVDMSKDHHVIV
jgi:hypothetical protein